MSRIDFSSLDAAGLNLQAVFDLSTLPADMRATLDPQARYRRLLLIGHGGRTLWERVKAAGLASEHPIDDFTVAAVRDWFSAQLPDSAYALLYPGDGPIGLQALGRLAGWHHESPFRVGVNAEWGSWFAYRAVALTDADLPPSEPMSGASPCARCIAPPCVAACPAGALADKDFRCRNASPIVVSRIHAAASPASRAPVARCARSIATTTRRSRTATRVRWR